MIDASQFRVKRIGEAQAGALVALNYKDGDTATFQYAVRIPDTQYCPAGALLLSSDKAPRFIRSNARCLIIDARPIVTWNAEATGLIDLTHSDPTPGTLLIASDKVLVCGQMPSGGGATQPWAWNIDGWTPEPLGDSSEWIAIRRWGIGTLGVSGKFQPLLTFGG